jgi:hypothetical protein
MKVFITKYALTSGIFSIEAQIKRDMAFYKRPTGSFTEHAGKNEWFSCQDKALERAEEMRIAKIKSLDKQIKKLSSMKFEMTHE